MNNCTNKDIKFFSISGPCSILPVPTPNPNPTPNPHPTPAQLLPEATVVASILMVTTMIMKMRVLQLFPFLVSP